MLVMPSTVSTRCRGPFSLTTFPPPHAGMEGCYNSFIGSENSAIYSVFERDLCGYMYLFNNNPALLSQYANLAYTNGNGVGGTHTPYPLLSAIFKDLGMMSDYGGAYTGNVVYGFPPYMGTTLYANMACTYEHWVVSALSPLRG